MDRGIQIMLNRRQLMTTLTVASATAVVGHRVAAQVTGSPPASMPGMAAGPMTPETCIDSCWRTHVMCLGTERYCIAKGGLHVASAHLALLSDCAEMCEKTANSLLRRSSQHAAVCVACAQMCDACAKECDAFNGDERMALCARTCRECADHCRDMSKMTL
jgi:hypothetical protein